MPHLPLLDSNAYFRRLAEASLPDRSPYFAFYSSLVDGIVTDPALMSVPIDDHLVHRGDGVFETAKFVDCGIYNLAAHLDRLFDSAAQIDLQPPFSRAEIQERILETCRIANRDTGAIRILLSRGTGGMGVNPYECPTSHLYILVYRLGGSFMDLHPEGATACTSRYSVKFDFLARVKSCNYLLNALMRKEAADRGVDFVFSFDEQDHLAEGPTESVGLLTSDGVLRVPAPDRILPGTTMDRVLELAEALRGKGLIAGIERAPIERDDLSAARELMIFGTTTDVTAVVRHDDQPIGDGNPGPIALALRELLLNDILQTPAMRTCF